MPNLPKLIDRVILRRRNGDTGEVILWDAVFDQEMQLSLKETDRLFNEIELRFDDLQSQLINQYKKLEERKEWRRILKQ
jgi:hypothetical protein